MEKYDEFFYPHILQLKLAGEWIAQFQCGEQPNAGSKPINTAERVDYIYKSVVFFPNEEQKVFYPGEEVRVIDDKGLIRVSGKIARFDVGRLEDNRIWL